MQLTSPYNCTRSWLLFPGTLVLFWKIVGKIYITFQNKKIYIYGKNIHMIYDNKPSFYLIYGSYEGLKSKNNN